MQNMRRIKHKININRNVWGFTTSVVNNNNIFQIEYIHI